MINIMAVFYTLRYTDQVDYLTISGNFAATSERLLQFPFGNGVIFLAAVMQLFFSVQCVS